MPKRVKKKRKRGETIEFSEDSTRSHSKILIKGRFRQRAYFLICTVTEN